MKRIFAVVAAAFFALLTVFAPALNPAVNAAGVGTVKFSMNNVDNAKPGDTITVTLSISGDYKASGMNLSVEYDPSGLTLESLTKGPYLKNASENGCIVVLEGDTLAYQGKIKLGLISVVDPITGSGDMFTMTFKVNSGVTVNQQVIMIIHEFVYLPVSSQTEVDIPFETKNSIITLVNGSDPTDGYNPGETGIGDNASSSPSHAPVVTPSGDPANSPVPSASPETTEPSGTDNCGLTDGPEPTVPPAEDTEAPTSTAEGQTDKSPAAPEKGSEKKNGWLLPVVICCGCGGVAAAIAGIMLAKKKNGR
ncbi:MAG: hypothetical protein IKS90_03155 [Clostridia bacterium]|nr:hypothetical protein [Clostridia bacterium]